MKKLAMGIEPIKNKEKINYFEWMLMHDIETKEANIQANYKFYYNISMHIK